MFLLQRGAAAWAATDAARATSTKAFVLDARLVSGYSDMPENVQTKNEEAKNNLRNAGEEL